MVLVTSVYNYVIIRGRIPNKRNSFDVYFFRLESITRIFPNLFLGVMQFIASSRDLAGASPATTPDRAALLLERA